ncbi:ATP-binding cassette, subfamily B, MsbA [Tranquillimonas rosea]|uniref:ATP-binding cassette, subfamily B, MsbA n=1 Tax=Tranquillimonas rosea TaxID=641238 RepID=A0A1H9WXW1_9RHOB|nr:ABC transporter ATP-binding protein [Tranquillimonas rosea]SES38684.1 ATP-binding cassette, subfamily B, MsbA [Tranquillimonas rosea]
MFRQILGEDVRVMVAWLWRDYLRFHRVTLFLALILMAIEGSMLGLLSWMVKPMFDEVLVSGQRGDVFWVAAAVAGVFAVRAVSSFGHRILMATAGQKISARLQSNLAKHLLTLDWTFFQDHSPGTLIERVRGDSQVVSQVWNSVFGAFGRDLISLLSLMAVAVSVDWVWALIAVAGAPLLMGPITLLQRAVRHTSRRARETAARLSNRLDEMFHGVNTIKLNGTEARDAERFSGEIDNFVSAQLRSVAGQAGIPALTDIVAAIGFFGVLSYGGLQIIDGEKTVGQFMSFFTAMALVFEPLRRLGNVTGVWNAALASFERLYALFGLRPTILTPGDPVAGPADATAADVVMEDVHFAYGDTPVLSGLTLTAKAGETTALVGPSGAGKSTIFNVLTRLVEPQSGQVSIGGTPIDQMDLTELRGLFSVVSQDAQMFDETLRDNIVMGRGTVPDAELEPVLTAAHVDDFLPKLSHGLDTLAGPRGSSLSGGQRQRVAIARALLRDTPILLLDEATSALDAQSEAIIQAALQSLSRGRTTLVIAHRLATVRDADRIVVMDKGRVVDEGSHDELLARGGLYADLYRLQFDEG